ncbi:uncharacterized [Tachysurus ichikawai]
MALTLGHYEWPYRPNAHAAGLKRRVGQWHGVGTSQHEKRASLLGTGGALCGLAHYTCITMASCPSADK